MPDGKRDITRAILGALEDSSYKWRTPVGIAKQIGIPEQKVYEILNKSELVVRSRKPNRRGEPLFSSRKKYLENTSIAQKIISAITNKIG